MEKNDAIVEPGPATATRRRRTVTIKDVARLSGVSAATVTRALQGHQRVLPATRQRVEDAARQLGYRPDHVARTLVTGMSSTIGLLIPTIGDPFWAEVAEGIERRATERDFSLLLASGHKDPERAEQMLEVFLGKRVDGVIITTSAGAWRTRPEAVGNLPVVVVGWDPPIGAPTLEIAQSGPAEAVIDQVTEASKPMLTHVAFDDVGAGKIAAQHLLDLGHRHFAFLGGTPTLSAVLRLLGGRLVLEEAGLAFERVLPGADTLDDGRDAALDLLRAEPRPTALIAFNDLVAIGALRAARTLGIHVPEELSVVGFDDTFFSAYTDPTLTTVRQPKREMGARAMDLIVDAMSDGAPVSGGRMPGTLVRRGSTAEPPATVQP
ncbi:MAG TPA: LacI family DNA-binding transcriptional regulator [Gaiellaceae bacterium]